jgi:hypothetical protein
MDKETASGLTRELRTVSRFYAVSIARLLELMSQAGFQDCRRIDEIIYQPILQGERPPQHRIEKYALFAPLIQTHIRRRWVASMIGMTSKHLSSTAIPSEGGGVRLDETAV